MENVRKDAVLVLNVVHLTLVNAQLVAGRSAPMMVQEVVSLL